MLPFYYFLFEGGIQNNISTTPIISGTTVTVRKLFRQLPVRLQIMQNKQSNEARKVWPGAT